MRKLIALLITLTLIMASSSIAFAGNGTGFVNDKNYNAGVFNGIYSYTDGNGDLVTPYPNVYLLMKWSKDWEPMADQLVGAWVTNHWTWYSDTNAENWEGWFSWATQNGLDTGQYKVTEFLKIMSVGDNLEAWAIFEAAGAYDAGWGIYDSGVPRYVVFSHSINVIDTTGHLVFSETKGLNKGLGKAIF